LYTKRRARVKVVGGSRKVVILSGVIASRSEAITKSKDLVLANVKTGLARSFHDASDFSGRTPWVGTGAFETAGILRLRLAFIS